MTSIKTTIILILVVLISACSQEPAEMHYGSDECVHCKMMITDSQFASQIVTEKGKAIKFDAIECMAVYHRNNSNELKGAKLWVNNYNNPGEWLSAPNAQFVKSEVVNSPMGESLLAFPSQEVAKRHLQNKPGKLMDWEKVSNTKMNMSM